MNIVNRVVEKKKKKKNQQRRLNVNYKANDYKKREPRTHYGVHPVSVNQRKIKRSNKKKLIFLSFLIFFSLQYLRDRQ